MKRWKFCFGLAAVCGLIMGSLNAQASAATKSFSYARFNPYKVAFTRNNVIIRTCTPSPTMRVVLWGMTYQAFSKEYYSTARVPLLNFLGVYSDASGDWTRRFGTFLPSITNGFVPSVLECLSGKTSVGVVAASTNTGSGAMNYFYGLSILRDGRSVKQLASEMWNGAPIRMQRHGHAIQIIGGFQAADLTIHGSGVRLQTVPLATALGLTPHSSVFVEIASDGGLRPVVDNITGDYVHANVEGRSRVSFTMRASSTLLFEAVSGWSAIGEIVSNVGNPGQPNWSSADMMTTAYMRLPLGHFVFKIGQGEGEAVTVDVTVVPG
jgi:hypothetical protein